MTALPDRRVHVTIAPATGEQPIEIVRYDKAGKWYWESGTQRRPLTIAAAVGYATDAPAVTWHRGVPGGTAFDAKVTKMRAAVAAKPSSWTDEMRSAAGEWAEERGLRGTRDLADFFEAEQRGDLVAPIAGLGYGPYSFEKAYAFALTASTQDAVLSKTVTKGGEEYWWAGFHDAQGAREVAGRLLSDGAVTLIVANTARG